MGGVSESKIFSSSNVFDSFEHYPSYEYDKTFSESIFGRFKIEIENQLMRLPIGKFAVSYTHLTLPTNREV